MLTTFSMGLAEFLCTDLARVLIAAILLVGTLALLLTGRDVPDALWGFDGAAIGFYFGGQVAKSLTSS